MASLFWSAATPKSLSDTIREKATIKCIEVLKAKVEAMATEGKFAFIHIVDDHARVLCSKWLDENKVNYSVAPEVDGMWKLIIDCFPPPPAPVEEPVPVVTTE